MLVQAGEIQYDYANQRVSAAGNVQIYYKGSTLEADRVIYDQKNKRLHAEGNTLHFALPGPWLAARPLLRTDLADEPAAFEPLGIVLRLDGQP